jgi:hypothetical protein
VVLTRRARCQPAFHNGKGRSAYVSTTSRSTCLHQMMIIAQMNHLLSSASDSYRTCRTQADIGVIFACTRQMPKMPNS